MSKSNQFSWMVKPRGFIKLLGGEYDLMQKAGGKTLLKFYASAVIILIIAVISFISIAYAIELLFHIIIVEIFLSLFLTALFVLLFIFIVNTFTKDERRRNLFNLSNITRLGFVMFIGLIISKPIEAFIYRNVISTEIENHKVELIKGHDARVDQLFQKDLTKLENEKARYTGLNVLGGFDGVISKIDNEITIINEKKKQLAATSASRIEQGAYFIYRIKVISTEYPMAWMVSLFVVLLFISPVFLIYSLSSDEEYFKRKNAQERKIIERAYAAFRQKYQDIFLTVHNQTLEFYSKYEDPPFNTVVRKQPACKNANDFHDRYAQV
jgi:hypothetical protein